MNLKKNVIFLLLFFSLFVNLYQYLCSRKLTKTVPSNEIQYLPDFSQLNEIQFPKNVSSTIIQSAYYLAPLYVCQNRLELAEKKINNISQCEEHLKLAEQRVIKYLPLAERFKDAKGSPALEVNIHEKIDNLLTNINNQNLDALVECRGSICQVEIIRKEGQEIESVLKKIQENEDILEITSNFAFYVGLPVKDEISGEFVWKHKVLLEINR